MKTPTRVAIAFLAAAAATTTSARQPAAASAPPPVVPHRIVSLSASATEWLYAIGAGEQVVAVDTYSNYPADAPMTDLSGFQPNLEAISTYDPDLVLLSSDRDGIVAALDAIDVEALVMSTPSDLADLHATVEVLGAAVGHADDAAAALAEMDEQLSRYTTSPGAPELTYYWELSDANHTVTSDTLIGALLRPLGLVSVADGVDPAAGAYPQLSAEFVLDVDPDVIIVAWAAPTTPVTVDDLAARPGWSTLTAVADDRVVVLDSDIASRWGPRVTEMVASVGAALGIEPVPSSMAPADVVEGTDPT